MSEVVRKRSREKRLKKQQQAPVLVVFSKDFKALLDLVYSVDYDGRSPNEDPDVDVVVTSSGIRMSAVNLQGTVMVNAFLEPLSVENQAVIRWQGRLIINKTELKNLLRQLKEDFTNLTITKDAILVDGVAIAKATYGEWLYTPDVEFNPNVRFPEVNLRDIVEAVWSAHYDRADKMYLVSYHTDHRLMWRDREGNPKVVKLPLGEYLRREYDIASTYNTETLKKIFPNYVRSLIGGYAGGMLEYENGGALKVTIYPSLHLSYIAYVAPINRSLRFGVIFSRK